MTEIKDVLGPELYRQVELLVAGGSYNGDPMEFISDAVESLIRRLRPDYVGYPPRPLEYWEPYPFDPENPEHVALYEVHRQFELSS